MKQKVTTVVSATVARQNLPQLLQKVRKTRQPFVIQHHNNEPDIIVKMYEPEVDDDDFEKVDFTRFQMEGGAFDYLKDEPDLYSEADGEPIVWD